MKTNIPELPHNIEVEATVLGEILFEGKLSYAKELKVDDFYATKHRVIFEAMKELDAKGNPIDSLILSDHLRKKGKLEEVGGASYISGLLGEVLSSNYMPNHIEIIKEDAIKRQIIEIGRKTEGRLNDADITQLISDMRNFYSELALMPTLKDIGFFDYGKLLEEGKAYAERGKETGLTKLDKVVKILPKELIIVGARPAHGKSSFAYNLFLNFLENYPEEAFIFFNLDVPSTFVMTRLATIWAKKHKEKSYAYKEVLPHFQVERFQEMPEIQEAFLRFDEYGKEKRLAIVNTPGYTVEQIIGHAERLGKEKRLGAIFIDYIELIKTKGRSESEELRIAHIVNSLRIASENLSTPIITLAQMNRASVERKKKGIEGRRPPLEGLRYSGRQEQEATTVLGLYNYNAEKIEIAEEEGRSENQSAETETTLEVIPLKNRGGMSNQPIRHNFDMVSGYISEKKIR